MAIQMEVAPPKDRFLALAIDVVPPFLLFLALQFAGFSSLSGLVALLASIYFVFRDVLGRGQSVGKRMRSLQVVDTETDRVPEFLPLVLRNIGFGVPGLNVVYAIVEGVRVIQHPQGLRFGDLFANTGVVKVPPDDREKLLVPKKERPSRESKSVVADVTATVAGGSVPDAPPVTTPSGPGRAPGAQPVSAAVAAATVPARSRAIELPPDTSVPATPVAPKPEAAGVKLGTDDPLKKLVDEATSKK